MLFPEDLTTHLALSTQDIRTYLARGMHQRAGLLGRRQASASIHLILMTRAGLSLTLPLLVLYQAAKPVKGNYGLTQRFSVRGSLS